MNNATRVSLALAEIRNGQTALAAAHACGAGDAQLAKLSERILERAEAALLGQSALTTSPINGSRLGAS